MGWAVDAWHIVESKAVMLGLIARAGGPDSVLDLDARHFLSFLEGVIRDDSDAAKQIDEMYEAARPLAPRPVDRSERRREIAELSRIFGG